MALTTIFTANNIQGDMVLIGNTLGLSKASNTLTPGTLGSIGAFITMDDTLQATGGWSPNTTLNWQLNSSPADLNIDPNSTIIKAFLFWAGDYINGSINLTTSVPNAVTLIDPLGTPHSVLPGTTSLNITGEGEGGESATYYQNFTDVTTIVQNGGEGTWVCGAVPCALNPTSNSMNFAGWALQVVYTNSSYMLTNVVIQRGPNGAFDGGQIATINYGGPPLKLFATIGYAEGDAILTGDRFNVASISTSGSNNPVANIFCSQMNYPAQTLNTSGPFGTLNANPVAGTNVVGGRQGWDVMKVPINLPSAAATASTDIPTSSDPGFIYTLGFVSQAAQPAIVMTKAVNKTTAQSGDLLTYTIVVKNSIQPAGDFIFTDTMPLGASFVSESLKVNGSTIVGGDPSLGVSLGTIPTSGATTITFNVLATPPYSSSKNIINFATGNYTFTGVTLNSISNDVVTTLTNLVQLNKTVDKSFAAVGDTLTYTLQLSNFSNTITSVVLIDTTPNGTSFITDSVNVNFINQPGEVTDPPGVTLTDLAPNGVTTISYTVKVNTTIPSTNPILNQGLVNYDDGVSATSIFSNIVSTKINAAILDSSKIVNKAFSNIGDTLTYSIVISNSGNVTANNIIFIDTIPSGTTLDLTSFKQDGILISGSSNPPGVTLPNSILPNSVSTITFNVTVNTIPNPNPIPNSASLNGTYTVIPTIPNGNIINTNTNLVNTQVNNASLSGITKLVDKLFSTCGEIITYTVILPNTGNITAINVRVMDTIPNSTVLVDTSIFVNGIQQLGANLSSGVTIPNIAPGTSATLTFSVKVIC